MSSPTSAAAGAVPAAPTSEADAQARRDLVGAAIRDADRMAQGPGLRWGHEQAPGQGERVFAPVQTQAPTQSPRQGQRERDSLYKRHSRAQSKSQPHGGNSENSRPAHDRDSVGSGSSSSICTAGGAAGSSAPPRTSVTARRAHGRGHSRTASMSISFQPGVLVVPAHAHAPASAHPAAGASGAAGSLALAQNGSGRRSSVVLTATVASSSGITTTASSNAPASFSPLPAPSPSPRNTVPASPARQRTITASTNASPGGAPASASASTNASSSNAPASATKRRSVVSFVASTGGGHFRGHSRTGSRALINASAAVMAGSQAGFGSSPAARGRPGSIIGLPPAIADASGNALASAGAGSRLSFVGAAGGSAGKRRSMMLVQPSEPSILAVEHGPEISAESFSAANRNAWADEPLAQQAAPASPYASLQPNASARRLSGQSAVSGSSLTPLASPSRRPLSNASLRSVAEELNTSLNAGEPRPLASPAAAALASFVQNSPAAPPSAAGKRASRHARRSSVATRRESMEIMGGLGFGGLAGAYSPAEKRRSIIQQQHQSQKRLSGLLPASVLFGVSESNAIAAAANAGADAAAAKRRSGMRVSMQQRGWDWQKALAQAEAEHEAQLQLDEGEASRLSALDKLEGKSRGNTPVAEKADPMPLFQPTAAEAQGQQLSMPIVMVQTNTPTPRDSARTFLPPGKSARTSRLRFDITDEDADEAAEEDAAAYSRPKVDQRGSRSSVQLPSFDELHGAEGMDKRRSMHLLEKNEKTTSVGAASAALTPADPNMTNFGVRDVLDSLALPSTAELFGSPQSPGRHAPDTPSMATDEDALGTLVEEDEEEEATTPPIRASLALNQATSTDAIQLASPAAKGADVAPKPLKLKSRPASLYLATALRNRAIADASESASTVKTESSRAEDIAEEEEETPPGELQQGWSMAQAQRNVKPDAEEDRSPSDTSMSFEGRKKAWRMSMPAANSASPSFGTVPPSRAGMRALRLGSITSVSSVADANSSFASSNGSQDLSFSSNTAPVKKRSSIIYKAADGGARSANGSFVRNASIDSSSTTASSAPPHANGFSAAAFDELKTKSLRDAALLDSTRKQLEAVQKELAGEKARAVQEYTELEQLLQAEKEALATRISDAEALATTRVDEAKAAGEAELEKLRQTLEETEAERDSYQEDVEGWRNRCKDLEKTLRETQATAEREAFSRVSLAGKAKRMAALLESLGHVSGEEDRVTEDDLALPEIPVQSGRATSPMRSGPPFASALPPPEQTVKLLSDMRQQIMNLANTLEIERKEKAQVDEELSALRSSSAQVRDEPELSPDMTASPDLPSELHEMPPTGVTSGRNAKPKRHIFAYDSSAGSVGQSTASIGSQSISNTTVSDGASDDESFAKAQAALIAAEQEDEGAFSLATGRGALGTLDEEEEEALSDSATAEAGKSSDFILARPSIDIEGAPVDTYDEEEAPQQQQHVAPFSQQDSRYAGLVPLVAVDGNVMDLHSPHSSDDLRSVTTMPSLQASDELHRQSLESWQSSEAASYSEEQQDGLPEEPRPEFIPTWSFREASEKAMRAVSQDSRQGKHAKTQSVEDFFGIMTDTVLPPLPGSYDSLDMPPIRVEAVAPRAFRAPPPPIKRYQPHHESSMTRDSISMSSEGHRSNDSSASSYLSRATGLLSGRVTSAFSGLSGYLGNQNVQKDIYGQAESQMGVEPAAPASKSWAQYHPDISIDSDVSVRSEGRGMPYSSSLPSVSSKQSISEKRFVPRYPLDPPMPLPVWQLDFSQTTGGPGSYPVIAL